jgi:TPM domain
VTAVAETFARSIHDKWGVGHESPCGGTGAVVFLAIDDRAMFISRGGALEPYLTDARLDAILRDMRPMLRRREYGEAVLRGVQELFRYVESGEPSVWEKAQDYAWIGLLAMVLGIAYWSSRRDQERRRQYADMTSRLSELDRAHAEVLQGKYQATSCPICLEAFPMADISESSAHSCGNTGVGGSSCREEERLGSDGMPLKLLRCGHCFDDTCFLEWVRTGNGQVDKCPICKAPVGVTAGTGDAFGNEGSESSFSSPLRPRRTIGSSADPSGHGETFSPRRMQGGSSISIQMDPVAAALRTYSQERLFRLGRLQGRYPQVCMIESCRRRNWGLLWTRVLSLCSRCFSFLLSLRSSLGRGRCSGGPTPPTKGRWRGIRWC